MKTESKTKRAYTTPRINEKSLEDVIVTSGNEYDDLGFDKWESRVNQTVSSNFTGGSSK